MIGRKPPRRSEEPQAIRGFDDFELRLGDTMRGERATLGKSLLDVQRDLKIKASYVAAIENSDTSAFESPGFIAGYVRSYARYLGMDPDQAFADFCRESAFKGATSFGPRPEVKTDTSRPNPARREGATPNEKLAAGRSSFVPQTGGVFAWMEPAALGSSLVLIALITGLGYGAWSVLQEIQKVQVTPVDQAPGIVAELDPLIGSFGGADGQMAAALPGADALDRLYRPQALDVPVLVARDGPISTLDPNSVGVLAPEVMTASALMSEPLAETELQVVEAANPDLTIFAVRPAWVRVTAVDGSILFEKILDAGERYTLPQTEDAPRLRAGNSGSVYFEVDGVHFGPVGTNNNVVKDVALSVEAVVASYQLADIEADPALAKIAAVTEASN